MKKISKADQTRIEKLVQKLKDQRSELTAALEEVLSKFSDQISDTRDELRGVAEDLVSEAQNYFDERSEKWQEGDAGEQYQSWIDRLQESVDAIDSDFESLTAENLVSEIESEIDTALESFESLPASPDEV